MHARAPWHRAQELAVKPGFPFASRFRNHEFLLHGVARALFGDPPSHNFTGAWCSLPSVPPRLTSVRSAVSCSGAVSQVVPGEGSSSSRHCQEESGAHKSRICVQSRVPNASRSDRKTHNTTTKRNYLVETATKRIRHKRTARPKTTSSLNRGLEIAASGVVKRASKKESLLANPPLRPLLTTPAVGER